MKERKDGEEHLFPSYTHVHIMRVFVQTGLQATAGYWS